VKINNKYINLDTVNICTIPNHFGYQCS